MGLRVGMCETLMPDVLAPKADLLRKILAWWVVTQRTLRKPQNCQNWGVGACVGMGACLGQYGMYVCTLYMCTIDQEIFMLKLIALKIFVMLNFHGFVRSAKFF